MKTFVYFIFAIAGMLKTATVQHCTIKQQAHLKHLRGKTKTQHIFMPCTQVQKSKKYIQMNIIEFSHLYSKKNTKNKHPEKAFELITSTLNMEKRGILGSLR